MSADKYLGIVSRQMEAIVYINMSQRLTFVLTGIIFKNWL